MIQYSVRCLLLAAIFTAATALPALADDTNMVRLAPGETVRLDTDFGFDLSEQGAIEFWYRHQSSQRQFKDFTNRTFLNDAYTVVMTIGEGADFTFAVIVGPGSDGQASIGFIRDKQLLIDNVKLAQHMAINSVPLRKAVFEKTDPIQLVSGETYHIILARPPGRDEVSVFVDGMLQQTVSDGGFGQTLGKPLVLGFDPKCIDHKGDAEGPYSFPFQGFIGGLRVWKTGGMTEADAVRLEEFGRSADPQDLTRLPGYGGLYAQGDFEGKRWDRARGAWVADAKPRLRRADALAGPWIAEGVRVNGTIGDSTAFDDFPVFTFRPATAAVLPDHDPHRAYHVFEDGNYIGSLTLKTPGVDEVWTFQHADEGWGPMDVRHWRVDDRWVLDWELSAVPRGKKLAGATHRRLRMHRRTLGDLGIKTPTVGKLTPREVKERLADSDQMTLVFLYTAYPLFFDRLYGSYNIIDMDPWNLLETGVKTDAKVLRVPGDSMFELKLNEQMIMPYDLDIVQSHLGLESTKSTLVSTASDYSNTISRRIGAGVSGSFTVGTGPMAPVSYSGTVNLSVVAQAAALKEMARQQSESTEKIVRDKWTKKYALYHRKDVMRVSDEFAKAVRALCDACADVPIAERRKLVYAFYDTWGTHYPFAMSFGSIELSETTVTDTMVKELAKTENEFDITINDGKTGYTEVGTRGKEDRKKVGTTVVRSFGSDDKPVPISVDLRPLFDLLTPQHFPDAPQVYFETRFLLAQLLDDYRGRQTAGVLDGMADSDREAAKEAIKSLEWPVPPVEYEVLGFRFVGIDLEPIFTNDDPIDWDKTINASLDGAISVEPRVTAGGGIRLHDYMVPMAMDYAKREYKRVQIIGKRGPADQERRLRVPGGAQMFGEPKETEVFFKVPKNSLQDNLFVKINAEFSGTVGRYAIDPVSTLDTDDMLEFDLMRSVKPVATRNVVVKALGGVTIPTSVRLEDEYSETRLIDGFRLWANSKPASVSVPKRVRIDDLHEIGSGTYSFRKSGRDLFQKPQNGDWRKGTGSFVTSLMAGRKATGMIGINIEYEYALLPSLRAARQANPGALGKSAWGDFEIGATSEPIDLLSRRSTATVRMPPSAPVDASLRAEPLAYRIEPPAWIPLTPRGFDDVAFYSEPGHPWALVNRGYAEWSFIATMNGRALAVDTRNAKNPRLHLVDYSPDDPAQVWIAEADGKSGDFNLKNKKTGAYLSWVQGEIDTLLVKEPDSRTRLEFKPHINLVAERFEPLLAKWIEAVADVNELVSPETIEAAKKAKANSPLATVTPERMAKEIWAAVVLGGDMDGDGDVTGVEQIADVVDEDLAEERFTSPETVAEIKREFDKAETPGERAMVYVRGRLIGQTWRVRVLALRIVKALDLNGDGDLDPNERMRLHTSGVFDEAALNEAANDRGLIDERDLADMVFEPLEDVFKG